MPDFLLFPIPSLQPSCHIIKCMQIFFFKKTCIAISLCEPAAMNKQTPTAETGEGNAPGLAVALSKMRRNIVPALSMSVIANAYDELLAVAKEAADSFEGGRDTYGTGARLKAAITKAEGRAQ